jgi:hypothetical protein
MHSNVLKWICPTCGRQARVPDTTPRINCSCGTSVDRLGRLLRVSHGDLHTVGRLRRRREKCRECVHQRSEDRCDLIDLGCRRTYLAALLADESTGCPLGIWSADKDREAE